MSEKLTELPEGWCYILLKDLGELKRGKSKHRPRNAPKLYGDFVPFIQTGEVARSGGRISSFSKMYSELGVQQSRIFPKGTICITIAANIADTGILGFDACFPDSIVGLITDYRLADSYFIEYFLRTIREDLAQFAPATAQANINIEILNKVFVPLPPLNEQKRIVATIEELNDRTQRAKEALGSIPQLCDRFRQSVLDAAFRGDLTADWCEQNPDVETASKLSAKVMNDRQEKYNKEHEEMLLEGKTPPKLANFEVITINFDTPETWISIVVESACLFIIDCLHSTPKFVDEGEYCIDTTCIEPFRINWDKARKVSSKDFITRTSRMIPKHNDILFSREGTIGTAVRVPNSPKLCLGQRMMMFRFSPHILPEYAEIYLQSPIFKQQYKPLILGTTSPHLNIGDIRKLAFIVPPLAEQIEIAKRVESIFRTIAKIERQYRKLKEKFDHLNQSILTKAFRGELVPQDPDDEPASVLLERIRAEREKLNNSKPKSDRTSKRKRKTVEGQGVIPGLE